MFLSSLISSITHGTCSVFGFRGVEGVSSDELALYAADQKPDTDLPAWQQYCLEKDRGNTLILLSGYSTYLKDLLMEIIKRMSKSIEIRDEKRVIKRCREKKILISHLVTRKLLKMAFGGKVAKRSRYTKRSGNIKSWQKLS